VADVVYRTTIEEGLYEPEADYPRWRCSRPALVVLSRISFSLFSKAPYAAATLALTALGLSLVFGVMRVEW